MRYEITFNENESLVTIRTYGDLTFNGFQLLLEELIADPKWRAGMNAIVDNRRASLDTLLLQDLQKISLLVQQLKNKLGSGGRCAIVLSDDADFTKIAMWKIMTEPVVGFNIEYFASIVIAEKWLNII